MHCMPRRGSRGLSEVQGALLSLVVTLVLIGTFVAFNINYIRPEASTVKEPTIELLSVLWTNTSTNHAKTRTTFMLGVEDYGSNPITIAYALVNGGAIPFPAIVYQCSSTSPTDYDATCTVDTSNILAPHGVYEVNVTVNSGYSVSGGPNYVTLATTNGGLYQEVLG